MPKTIYFPDSAMDSSGIDITYYKIKRELYIGGWYDSCVGIQGTRLTLRQLFDRLGITEKDCRKAFKDETI